MIVAIFCHWNTFILDALFSIEHFATPQYPTIESRKMCIVSRTKNYLRKYQSIHYCPLNLGAIWTRKNPLFQHNNIMHQAFLYMEHSFSLFLIPLLVTFIRMMEVIIKNTWTALSTFEWYTATGDTGYEVFCVLGTSRIPLFQCPDWVSTLLKVYIPSPCLLPSCQAPSYRCPFAKRYTPNPCILSAKYSPAYTSPFLDVRSRSVNVQIKINTSTLQIWSHFIPNEATSRSCDFHGYHSKTKFKNILIQFNYRIPS